MDNTTVNKPQHTQRRDVIMDYGEKPIKDKNSPRPNLVNGIHDKDNCSA